MRTLFVGEAPNRRGEHGGLGIFLAARALGDATAYRRDPGGWLDRLAHSHRRLADWLNRTPQVNLLKNFPGDRWPVVAARIGARELAGRIGERPCRIVVIGLRTAGAMGIRGSLFDPTEWQCRPAVVLPHPSGRNFYWNDGPPARARVLAKLLQLIPKRGGDP